MANVSAGGRIDGPFSFTGFGSGLAGGDFNGDGVNDLAITYQQDGGNRTNSTAVVQIIYGGDGVFDGEAASATLTGGSISTNGETDIGVGIDVPGPLDFADVDGDGTVDLLIGAPRALSSASETSGAAFALFGAEGTDPFAFTFPDLTDGTTGSGFTATGGQVTGSVFTNLGDINADGEDELFLGSPFATSPEGGQASGLGFIFTPSGDGATDFATSPTGLETTLFGDALTFLAEDAAGIGDVNGDGIADFVVSGRGADGAGTGPFTLHSGEAYLIFGADGGLPETLNVTTLNGANGARIIGSETFTVNGRIEAAGDVNGDGLGDFLLQDDGADTDAPLFYLVYGSNDGFSSTFDISTRTSERVSMFGGVSTSSAASGIDMAGVGDVNGDGFDDILLSRAEGGPLGAGEAALLFGSAAGFGAAVDLDNIADGAGYRFQGTDYSQRVGYAVTGPGDLNGDGIADLAIGASTFNPPSNADYTFDAPGAVFVIYGGAAALEALDQQSGDDGVISLGDVTGVVDIPDDTPTVFSLGGDLEVSEGALGFNVVVTRSSDKGAAEFDLSFSGSATSEGENADFTRVIGQTNTFEDGETSKLITFKIEQDAVREPDETVEVELSIISADQPATLGDGFQTITILDNDEPTIFGLGADFSVSEADEADRTFAVTVTRSSGVGAAEISLTPTGTADGADFNLIGGSSTFIDGETMTSLLYRVEADKLVEGDETISFELGVVSSNQAVLFDDATQVVTILDDDEPTIYSLGADFSVSETDAADRTFAITVTRSSDVGAAEVSLTPTGSAGSADFSRIGGSSTFADGEVTTSAFYRVESDTLAEVDETISFELDVVSSDQPVFFDDTTQIVTILDDDEPVKYSLDQDFAVSEGALGFNIVVSRNSDEGAAEFDLTLTGSAVTGGANPDFTRIGGTNTFADGEMSKLITYKIEQDVLREPDEKLFVQLSVTSATQLTTLGDANQTITILDNDDPVVYSLGIDAVVSEADGIFGVTITRSNDLGAAEINLGLSGATGDVARIGGTNTFEEGETTKLIIFRIENDSLVEPDETVDFSLSLISADQPGVLGDATQKVTILDDDEATFGGPIRGGLTPDLLLGTRQADVILGGGGSDTLRGGGGGGGDTLKGGGGDDNIKGNGGADVIRGGGGSDIVRSGSGADTVKGGGGADLLNGGGGADVLSGGGGSDTLTGKGGDDTLKGNGGADVFQFRASDRNDTIADFRQGQDKIQIQSGARTFEALTFEQDGRDVLIGFGSGQVRVVTDNAGAFDENDFIF